MAGKSLHHPSSTAGCCMSQMAAFVGIHAVLRMIVPMRFVAAEAGFFPPGPLTLFADMVNAIPQTKRKRCHFRSAEGKRRVTTERSLQSNLISKVLCNTQAD